MEHKEDEPVERDNTEKNGIFTEDSPDVSQTKEQSSSSSLNYISANSNSKDISADPAIGIDLGTTFSCASICRNGTTEIIPNADGSRLTPSTVFFEPADGAVFVGKKADLKFPKSPKNALLDAKRFIGRQFEDEFISRYNKSNKSHFTLVRADDGKAAFEVDIAGEKVIKKPEDVSAEVLKYLKRSAEEYLGCDVNKAVITVPARFSNSQRKATKKAAEQAGLSVLKLITEPTAAAIHYVSNKSKDNSNILVFDFGGGTLDISLINVKDNAFEVKSVYGDTLLGGRNFDELLFEHFYKDFEHNMNNDSFTTRKLKRRLNDACIEIKEMLSNTNEYTHTLALYDGESDLELTLTRSKFEEISKDICQQITGLLELALDESGVDKSEIDEVILVGGSTRIPKIQEILGSIFDPKKIRSDLNPDEAVSAGASIHAAVLAGYCKDLEKYKVTEVTPISLGIATFGNVMSILIPKNSPLPATAEETYSTVANDQSVISVSIYEGERKNTEFNNFLGEFLVEGLPKGRAGDIKISVNFNLDEDGILSVVARETGTGKNNKLIITMEQFRLSERKINYCIEEARKHKAEDDAFESAKRSEAELLIFFNQMTYADA